MSSPREGASEPVDDRPVASQESGADSIPQEVDQSPPPPYSACLSGDNVNGVDPLQHWKVGSAMYPMPPPPFDAPSGGASTATRPLLPPTQQTLRVVVDQRGVPVSVPPGIQVVVIPARDTRNVVESRDDESKRMRSIALPLAVLSLFFGSLFCAIPALICACRRHAPAVDYRKSIALSTIALLIGVTGLIFAAIRANRNALAYM